MENHLTEAAVYAALEFLDDAKRRNSAAAVRLTSIAVMRGMFSAPIPSARHWKLRLRHIYTTGVS